MSESQIFIIGSCVTRDAFALIPNGYRLADYVCRTSFGSAFADRPFLLQLVEIDPDREMVSQFQRSMVEIDLSKGLGDKLSGLSSDTIVVVDLIDERFQLLEFKGTIATHSVEMQRPKPTIRFPDIRVIKANSDEHFDFWKAGIEVFGKLIDRLGLRIVLNKVFWSERDTEGGMFNKANVDQNNAYLSKMYDHFETHLSCETIRYGTPFVSDHLHKWGLSPFHYRTEVYQEFLGALDSVSAQTK
jgi:hypothetical protein